MPLCGDTWPIDGCRAVVFNTEAAYFFLNDATYREHVRDSGVVYCDGAGLALYLQLRFGQAVKRYHGPDVLGDYFACVSGRRVLILGGSDYAHKALAERFPRFIASNLVSMDGRYFESDQFAVLAKTVAVQPFDDVLIFFGLRRQEHFQYCLHAAGFRGCSIGLGAAIDFLSGAKVRSGYLWQKLGLEWLPRLVREPRMLMRVIRSAALFTCFARTSNEALNAWLFASSVERGG